MPLALTSGSGGSYDEETASESSGSEEKTKKQRDEGEETDGGGADARAARAAARAAAAAVSPAAAAAAASSAAAAPETTSPTNSLYPPAERSQIRESWDSIMRWSRAAFRDRKRGGSASALDATSIVAVFGGGSFGTAMAVALARQKADLDVRMLLRDPALCADINSKHENARYLPGR